MSHLAYKELAEGMQLRLEERCKRDGHVWETLDGVAGCHFCHTVSDNPGPNVDWKQRALAHATALRAMLIVKDPEPGTAGAAWLDEANDTFKLAGITPGVGIGARS